MSDYYISELNHGIDSSNESFVNCKIGNSKHLNISKSVLRLVEHAYQIDMDMSDIPMNRATRQAIITKVLPCTDTKGMRHKAFNSAKSMSVVRDYHAVTNRGAAQELSDKLGWGEVVIGTAIDTDGTVAWITERAE